MGMQCPSRLWQAGSHSMKPRISPGAGLRWTVSPLLVTCWMTPVLGAESSAHIDGGVFSWARFLAPFHMVVLHLPIGFFSAVILLEVWTWMKPSEERRRVIGVMLNFGVLATAATMVFGFLRAIDGGYEELTLHRHRGWGIAAAALMLIAAGLHASLRRQPAPGGCIAFRVLLFAGFIALTVAGHHGGSLTHGSSFLTQNAPAGVRHLLEGQHPSTTATHTSNGTNSARAQAILEHRCIACHGAEKQKGGLRLDSRAAMLKGGKSGHPALVPGDPGRSELIRASLLPLTHDDVMPPDGKEPLTTAEQSVLIDWIRLGAQ